MAWIAPLVCCAALAGVGLTAGAAADRQKGVDKRTGFAFVLKGKALTVRIRPGAGADQARSEVYGKTIDALCTTSYGFSPAAKVVRRAKTWPNGQDAVTYVFQRDISRKAKACLIEHEAADVADVAFSRPAFLSVHTRYSDGKLPSGSRSFVRLRDVQDRPVLFEAGDRFYRLVEPGRYRLIRYERGCQEQCKVLGPPGVRCAQEVRLRPGQTLRAVVRVDTEARRCLIDISD